MRSALVPFTASLEPLSECMLLGLLTSLAVMVLFKWSGVAFFFVHTLLWFILDYTLLKSIQVSVFVCVCVYVCVCLYIQLSGYREGDYYTIYRW